MKRRRREKKKKEKKRGKAREKKRKKRGKERTFGIDSNFAINNRKRQRRSLEDRFIAL